MVSNDLNTPTVTGCSPQKSLPLQVHDLLKVLLNIILLKMLLKFSELVANFTRIDQ